MSDKMITLTEFSEKEMQKAIEEKDIAFRKLIRQRLGIVVQSHQVKNFHRAIIEACRKFNCSISEYYNLLSHSPDQSPILEHLVVKISVGETYFFRDKKQMELLQHRLLPKLIQAKRDQNTLSLRIWSAGCSSGEEIYTIAILLNELIPDIDHWNLNLLGTDINTKALKKAISGYYTDWSMRSISAHYKERYFTKENNHYVLIKKIRDLVRFDYLNLNNDNYPSIFNGTNAQDLTICRNVLIYFDHECILSILKKLSASIAEQGFLLLGASDPVDIKATNLVFHSREVGLFSLAAQSQLSDTSIIPVIAPERKSQTKKTLLVQTKIHQPAGAPVSPKPSVIDHEIIQTLLRSSQWQELLNLLNLYESQLASSAFLLNAKAIALANIGKLDESVKFSQACIALDPTNIDGYFTYALALIELNRLDEAEKAIRKTLFLNHQSVIGHYQLGLLLIRKHQLRAGLKSLNNTLAIAKSNLASQEVQGYRNLTYGRLVEILKYEIGLYSTLGKNNDEPQG